ncbi:MAG: hypothetical protein GY928_02755 [Colwellia sp.]|nr:hypothetical protein [Colwellia sp.]
MLDLLPDLFDQFPEQLTLGTVDLSGLKFIQFKTNLIAARIMYHRNSIKKASNNE